jgi:hypothetical protein
MVAQSNRQETCGMWNILISITLAAALPALVVALWGKQNRVDNPYEDFPGS